MRILFHRFRLGDVDDVDLYLAMALEQWKDTDHGRWVMQHATNVRSFTGRDVVDMWYRADVIGELADGPLITEYALRWRIEQYW